jgi:hypothetical protein
MDTRERLQVYQELVKAKKMGEAEKFVSENQMDKRFTSLVDVRKAFLAGFREELESV